MLLLSTTLIAAAIGVAAVARARTSAGSTDDGSSTDTTAVRRGDVARLPIERTLAPPTPLAPRYGESTTGVTTLSWWIDDRTDGARVELSPTPDFDDAATVRVDVAGDHADVPTSPGVWYWRLRGRLEGAVGDRTSHTWMFYVPEPSPRAPRIVMPPSLARADPKSTGEGDDGAAPDGWSGGPLVRRYVP